MRIWENILVNILLYETGKHFRVLVNLPGFRLPHAHTFKQHMEPKFNRLKHTHIHTHARRNGEKKINYENILK